MTLAVVAAYADLVMAAGVGILRSTHTPFGEYRVEGLLPTFALMLLLAAPGVLALIGAATAQPVLFAVAGVACFPLAIISMAALPIWLPGAGFLISYNRASRASRWSGAQSLMAASFLAVLLLALVLLVAAKGQYTYTYPGGSEGGDYYLPSRALWTIGVIVADLALAAIVAIRMPHHSPAGAP
jgi:hypothetical protein